MLKSALTNEKLKKHFKNNFELVNFAISFTRNKMQSGEPFNLSKMLAEMTQFVEQGAQH